MDENTQAKFAEKIKELLNMAKKKKNVLEYQEISDFFADMPLEEEQMEKVLEYLDQNNVDVLRITDDDGQLHRLRAFIDTLKTVERVEILPYHTLGVFKWKELGIPYALEDVEPPTKEQVEHAREIIIPGYKS